MVARLFTAPLVAVLAVGCAVGPAYERPPVETPQQWREASATAAWPSPQWWQEFGSAELDGYVAAAKSANLDLAAAVARVEEADAQARIAGAPLLPTLDLAPRARRSRQVSPVTSNYTTNNDFATELSSSYELDFWGKNRSARGAARANAMASRYSREVVALTVVTSMAQSYFQVLGLQQRLQVTRQNLANAQRVFDALELEYKMGTATQLDVVQQRTLLANASAAVPPVEQALAQAVNALAILLGRPPEAVPVATRSLDTIAIPEVTAGLPSELLARRPDVHAAEAQLIAANFDIRNVRAQFLPDFSLTAQGGVESRALSKLFSSQSPVFDIGAQVLQHLFTGGRLTGQLRYSQAHYRELLANYRKATISAYGDVEDSLAAIRGTRDTLAQQRTALESARTAFSLAQTQFQTGTLNLLALLNTQTALFNTENSYLTARLNQLQAVVGLYKSLGGGWSGELDDARLAQSGEP
jgi:NodT family efflux transporter outer membrane factor (OMF) lipoprotein